MKVTWTIDDGYVGARREHTTDVDDDDLAECETLQDREELISEYIEEDFRRAVCWEEVRRDGE